MFTPGAASWTVPTSVIGPARQRAVAIDRRDRDHVGVGRRIRGGGEWRRVVVRRIIAGGADDDHAVLVGVMDRAGDRRVPTRPAPTGVDDLGAVFTA